jgi:hypothetical protein
MIKITLKIGYNLTNNSIYPSLKVNSVCMHLINVLTIILKLKSAFLKFFQKLWQK